MCAKAEDGTHTLMKGYEMVETYKECSDFLLFGKGWRWDCFSKEV